MSAIVADPVPNWAGPVVVSCILAPPRLLRSDDNRGGLRRRYLPGSLLFDVGQEQRLIDSALEDRHAQLHALLDDLATLHAGFASELRGREVNCHQSDASCEVCHVAPTVAPSPDVHNVNLLNLG